MPNSMGPGGTWGRHGVAMGGMGILEGYNENVMSHMKFIFFTKKVIFRCKLKLSCKEVNY